MLYNPGNKNIYVHKFDQKIFPTYVLSLWLFIPCLLTMVYLEVVAGIQC